MELAEDIGISKKTLERARKAESIKSKKVDNHWVWSLE